MSPIGVFLLALLFFLAACGLEPPGAIVGSGRVVTRDYALRDFDAIRLATSGRLEITQGETFGIQITADDNILPVLQPQVERGMLVLRTDSSVTMLQSETLVYHVTLPHLRELYLSSSGDIALERLKGERLLVINSSSGDIVLGEVQLEELDAALHGSGDLNIAILQAHSITTAINGSGEARLAGNTGTLHATISGSGDLHATDLAVGAARMTVNGSGDARIWVLDELEARISGGGNVEYYGAPALHANNRINGSGELLAHGTK